MKKEKYLIEITRPDGVSVGELRAYIKDAVASWGGQFHPNDPLFGHKNIKVKRINDGESK